MGASVTNIDMARAQMFLYQSLEAAAVSDVKNCYEYLIRRTVAAKFDYTAYSKLAAGQTSNIGIFEFNMCI